MGKPPVFYAVSTEKPKKSDIYKVYYSKAACSSEQAALCLEH
jgi:hypothetical protein